MVWLKDIHLCTPHSCKTAGLFFWMKQGTGDSHRIFRFCILVIVVRLDRLLVSSVGFRFCVCLFACFGKVAVCSCVSCRLQQIFHISVLHLHPLPTHLPPKGLTMVLFSFYSIPLFSLTLFIQICLNSSAMDWWQGLITEEAKTGAWKCIM